MKPSPPTKPTWSETDAAKVRQALSQASPSRRSFLHSGVWGAVVLGGILTLVPREARAQSSGY